MTHSSICLHEKEGPHNTEATINAVKEKVDGSDIDQIVVATTTGQTALACARSLPHVQTIVGVTMHAVDKDIYVKRDGQDVLAKDPQIMEEARQAGVVFYTGVHPFKGAVSSALSEKVGGYATQDIMAEMLKQFFSTGTKVAIECTLMAADGGLIDTGRDVIALGGHRGGADTALVIKPAFSYRLFELKVKEWIALPREH